MKQETVMERPVRKPIGTPVGDLDTPALVVDLEVMEKNLKTLHAFFRKATAKVRPYTSAHRCPAIAHKQLAAGGTAGGICVATLGEAEVFAASGVPDNQVMTTVVTPHKVARACALAHHTKLTLLAETPENICDLGEAARAARVAIGVLLPVGPRDGVASTPGVAQTVELARLAGRTRGVVFKGLFAHPGKGSTAGQAFAPALEAREAIERAGLEVKVLSAGGPFDYRALAELPGVTEVRAGAYALMDARHGARSPEFKSAARVLATVSSRPDPSTIIVDCGQKAIGADLGLPVADGVPGLEVVGLSAEHGKLKPAGPVASKLDVGDKVWLVPFDIGTCVNLYDYMSAVRNGRLEAVWDVAARGRYQ